jgi:2-polyprenyl-3-methyl-5-hydroxy-6-metoxy-1,4-benzoquinol methylase
MATRHTCPICGDAERLRFLCQAAGMDVFACSACGADHVWPMPTAADLKAYYDRREWFEGGEPGGYANYDAQTGWSLDLVRELLASFGETKNLSVLDVGCGYGTHLALAAECGWKCFGVEISDHARGVAQERLADRAFIVAGVDELIPHPFDLVLILDTLEHLPSPYPTLYHLFSIGAITPKTKLVIATPNAACDEARRNPAGWAYRHPPSHLVFYAPETLRWLLDRLRFTSVSIRGLSPAAPDVPPGDLARHAGLLAVAEGSDFTEFMRERYVPGTWSKIAEYEHVPRYALARTLARGKTVLDFGCGTGYGAALLAETAARVTGLDIDAGAVAWAGQTHRAANLEFVRADDLGASLPAKSFDLVTCFEMIEHVDHATQQAVIASFARLLPTLPPPRSTAPTPITSAR